MIMTTTMPKPTSRAQKALGRVAFLKLADDAPPGSVLVRFSMFNMKDAHDDVTMPGAFGEQEVLISAYNHESWWGSLPVGKGRIYEDEEGALFEGTFNLNTLIGKETYETVKFNGGLQEWSYGYDVVKCSFGQDDDKSEVRFLEEVKVWEVSPVIVGAGPVTGTVEMKTAERKAEGEMPCPHCGKGLSIAITKMAEDGDDDEKGNTAEVVADTATETPEAAVTVTVIAADTDDREPDRAELVKLFAAYDSLLTTHKERGLHHANCV